MIEKEIDLSKQDWDSVRSLLCHRVLGAPLPGFCSEWDMQGIYRLAKQHDFAHLLADVVREQGLSVSPELGRNLQKEKLTAIWRHERQQVEQRRILGVLEDAGIDHILLKGDVVRQHYPEPWMRTSCDIDVLVRREELERAEQVLTETLGYTGEGKHYHDVSMRSESGVHLELHFSLNAHHALADRMLAAVWQNVVPAEGCAHRYEMTRTFFLLYFVAHMAGHFLRGGCGVRAVLDLYLLERAGGHEPETLRELLAECELEQFYDGMHRLGCVWFAGEEGDPSLSAVGEYILSSGIYGTKESRIAVSRGQGGGEAKYWYNRLFQSRELLQGTYPQLEKRPYLYPYYQVKRWLRFFDPKTRRRILREAELGHGIDDGDIASAKEVLTSLGLKK